MSSMEGGLFDTIILDAWREAHPDSPLTPVVEKLGLTATTKELTYAIEQAQIIISEQEFEDAFDERGEK